MSCCAPRGKNPGLVQFDSLLTNFAILSTLFSKPLIWLCSWGRSSLIMVMCSRISREISISQKNCGKIRKIRDFQTSRTLRLLGVRQSSWALRNRTPRDLSIAAVFSVTLKLLVPPTNAGLEGENVYPSFPSKFWGFVFTFSLQVRHWWGVPKVLK